jgi:hypothetical protein
VRTLESPSPAGAEQSTIDRHFFRRKYNAEKALTAFSLSVGDEVDMENLARVLLAIVNETLQPGSVSVWLLETGDGRPQTMRSDILSSTGGRRM